MKWIIQGHAIISDNDCIADKNGNMPVSLKHHEDMERFQEMLDKAIVVVMGRQTHELHPNHKKRSRLVLSSLVDSIEHKSDGWWWNPNGATLESVLSVVAPNGGVIAIAGGRRVYDYFLDIGYDEFHLSRVQKVDIHQGVPLFTQCDVGQNAEAVLKDHDLSPTAQEWLNKKTRVSIMVWEKR